MSVLPSLRVIVALVAISILLFICVSYQRSKVNKAEYVHNNKSSDNNTNKISIIDEYKSYPKQEEVPQFSDRSEALAPAVVGSENILISIDKLMETPFTLQQDDVRLIKHIQEKHLYPPSTVDYSLKNPTNDDPSMGQSKEIRNIFGDKVKNGFFIECGALDGETRSNTLVFEKRFGWKGVLIEGDPKNFELVKKKNRKAHALSACLSTKPYPNTVMFKQSGHVGKISNLLTHQQVRGYAEVLCFPFYSILLALNRTSVDYFSLDVEGAELQVLKTIPWDKVDIKTLSVEFIHAKEGKDAIREYMKGIGYSVYKVVVRSGGLANDFIFYRNDVTPKIPPPT